MSDHGYIIGSGLQDGDSCDSCLSTDTHRVWDGCNERYELACHACGHNT